MLKEKEGYVRNFMSFLDVWMAWMAYHISLSVLYKELAFIVNKDILITNIIILVIWLALSKALRLNEIYRSRPVSAILYACVIQGIAGVATLALFMLLFNLYYPGFKILVLFGILSIVLSFYTKLLIYKTFKIARRRGFNTRNVIFICDKSGASLLNSIHRHYEWGYVIVRILGDEDIKKQFGHIYQVSDRDTADLDSLIGGRKIDEVIYACEYTHLSDVQAVMDSCAEVGVTFRLFSPFLNMLKTRTHIQYLNTQALLTMSNTPNDTFGMHVKRLIDIVVSLVGIIILSPLFVSVALVVKLGSRGPVFFSQKRVGLRGRHFKVHKFRTMVVDAEKLKNELMDRNEMDGPVFKIANDPRITRCGRFLRKTSLDELPQFFNVLFGDMSIVGPRPPLPSEVEQYERWQLRRLSMRPGITCLWQIAPNRNDISFEEWMRMDMEYIDNWSIRLDFILILKTIRTVFRADGK